MAEGYTVLARRYRSQNFDELVGQEAIAQTLKNAITSNRVAHAFLFTGTRGVGKTSAARILAKALNCPQSKGGQPCGTCETCKAIGRGEDMDVIEIDGASNNGVDQVRELRQSAGIRLARSPFKIYIIDEVHMLSTGAFNALLKTLEEPPEHVKFIFATTDVHKVPATIISRVQRFDFKNIPTARIAGHLAEVCKQEGVDADAAAVQHISRLGNGSMRDALSLLDRVLSLGEKKITEKLLEELLGKPAISALAELVEAVAANDAGAVLTQADELLKGGMGPEQVLSELIDFLRNLMLVSVCGAKTELLEATSEQRPRFVELAAKFDGATLVHLIALAEHTLRSLKNTTMGRALFDALIVRMAMSEQFSSIRELLKANGGAGGGGARAAAGALSPASAVGQKKNELSSPPVAAPVVRVASYPVPAKAVAAVPSPAPGAAAAAPADSSDLGALWESVRRHLVETKNGSININLGPTSRLQSYDAANGQAVLAIPAHMKAYAGDKVRAKLEEVMAGVVGRPVRLTLLASDELGATSDPNKAARAGTGGQGFPARSFVPQVMSAAPRVPPELDQAVRNQPVVRSMLEALGGDVKRIEILETQEQDSEGK